MSRTIKESTKTGKASRANVRKAVKAQKKKLDEDTRKQNDKFIFIMIIGLFISKLVEGVLWLVARYL